ncbi:MAG: EFR1 family ferrodoxin [Firmicutes bacterium]|nr:EFR1 family ferrodoxin [Bacillota bacterium]
MNIDRILNIYFSPTGGTAQVSGVFCERLAEALDVTVETIDISLPKGRRENCEFGPADMLLLAVPTYAGRLPNKLEPWLREMFRAEGSPCAVITTFGNRSFDSSLAELADIAWHSGARVISGGVFVTRHAFSDKVGEGRPDGEDLAAIADLAEKTAQKVLNAPESEDIAVPEELIENAEIGLYYVPLTETGERAVFLKAKPKVDTSKCISCASCVRNCPMGAIDPDIVNASGTCIKCQACVRKCPRGARYFDDEAFLSHVRMLERDFVRRAENKVYV